MDYRIAAKAGDIGAEVGLNLELLHSFYNGNLNRGLNSAVGSCDVGGRTIHKNIGIGVTTAVDNDVVHVRTIWSPETCARAPSDSRGKTSKIEPIRT